MNRLPTVLCLSLSVLAVALASFALLRNEPGGVRSGAESAPELRELPLVVASLSEKVEKLESRQVAITQRDRSPRSRRQKARVPSREPADLEGQVAALTERLATLEDEETIARLAQSGEEQVVQKELAVALDRIGDPDAAPEDRLGALENLRRLQKASWPLVSETMKENEIEERDIVMPLLELAQDATLEPGFRAEILHRLDSKVPELRQPLLDMLSFEDSPEVRGGSLEALMYHLGDSTVRDAIRQASREDRHESVQSTAREYLPKVEHFYLRAAEAERGKGGATAAEDTSTGRAAATGQGK